MVKRVKIIALTVSEISILLWEDISGLCLHASGLLQEKSLKPHLPHQSQPPQAHISQALSFVEFVKKNTQLHLQRAILIFTVVEEKHQPATQKSGLSAVTF